MASLFSLETLSPYHVSRQLLIYEHPAEAFLCCFCHFEQKKGLFQAL